MPCGRWTPALPKPTPRIRRREQHLRARLIVCRDRRPRARDTRRPCRRACSDQMSLIGFDPDTRAAAPGRSGRGRSVIRHRGERLHRVAEDVEAGRCRDRRRHRARVVGIEQAERRLQPPARDAGLRVQPLVVEDAHAGRLAAGARGRRDRDQRLQRTGNGQTLADRRVHVVEKILGRIASRRGSRPSRCRSSIRRRRRRTRRGWSRAANAIASRNDSSLGSTRMRS